MKHTKLFNYINEPRKVQHVSETWEFFSGLTNSISSIYKTLTLKKVTLPLRQLQVLKKMSGVDLSHFTEKSGVVSFHTNWGRWWQTVHEVHIEVNLQENTKGKEVSVKVTATEIECIVCKDVIFKGRLFKTVHPEETVWTIEDKRLLNIVLAKANESKDEIWEWLIDDETSKPDVLTLHEMRKKIDLEHFQIEHPGLNFSNAKLDKRYDKLPGWSQDAVKKGPEAEGAAKC